jgi:hypothetical protein
LKCIQGRIGRKPMPEPLRRRPHFIASAANENSQIRRLNVNKPIQQDA